MSGPYKNSGERLSVASFEFKVKELIRLELELAVTFINLAHTKYSMGNVAGGNFSRNNAEKAYREALKYFRKLSDLTSLERRKLMGLVDQAHDAIASLPKAKSLTH
jgi:hypothetical protein